MRRVAARDEAVIRAFDDREADIERIAHRIELLALDEIVELARIEGEMIGPRMIDPDQREVVGDVESQHLERAVAVAGVKYSSR